MIGIHGHYPKSANLDEFWDNLKNGRDLVESVPANRWDNEEWYDQDPNRAKDGKLYCKWGGFVADVDLFEHEFFNISHAEAKLMDPQERLFIQSAWGAIERSEE